MLSKLARFWRILFGTVPAVGRYYKHIETGCCVFVDAILLGAYGEPHSISFRPIVQPGKQCGISVMALPQIREFNKTFIPATKEEALAAELMKGN